MNGMGVRSFSRLLLCETTMSKRYQDKELLKELYHEKGLNQIEIAERLDCGSTTVSHWLHKHGLNKKSPWKDEDKLYKQYVEQGKTTLEIAEELGCNDVTIYNWLQKHGIETHYDRREKPWQDKETLIKAYVDEGVDSYTLAKRWDCAASTIRAYVNKFDLYDPGDGKHYPALHTDDSGYERIVPADGRAGILHHRLIIIAHGADPNKVYSGRNYHVHHKNGVKWDNREENIELLTSYEHNSMHAKDQPRARGRFTRTR